jgi:hypothetical protein
MTTNCVPSAMLSNVTVAPGTAASVASRTVPRMLPPDCAANLRAPAEKTMKARTRARTTSERFRNDASQCSAPPEQTRLRREKDGTGQSSQAAVVVSRIRQRARRPLTRLRLRSGSLSHESDKACA